MTAEREAMTLKHRVHKILNDALAAGYMVDTSIDLDTLHAIDAHLSCAAEPVYQTRTSDDAWWDISKEQYDITWEPNRRVLYTNPPEPARDAKDSARLDALEADVAKHGPLVLHNGEGTNGSGYRGIGMANTGRSLRQALDMVLDTAMQANPAAMAQESGE